MNTCPQCGSIKSWYFDEGEYSSDPEARFDKETPDTGYCRKCGFHYSEHALHPLGEQLETFREERKRGRVEKQS